MKTTVRQVRFRQDGHPATPVDVHHETCDGRWVVVYPVSEFTRFVCSCGARLLNAGFVYA